ncbi:MAG TPA: LON peptidase substrate-binding domain-containing protein, partial [Fimbriimonadaceae bacterium]|nr:LON peptidase substrate-binding domain-containing protein [Fimbriimonadaceae bacterium]
MPFELEEMPLFPLNTVLFPYATVQLHVFEDRYRDLVRNCIEFDRPFGIVLIRNGDEVGGQAEPYMVGTAVRIVQVHHF